MKWIDEKFHLDIFCHFSDNLHLEIWTDSLHELF